jgi:adenylate cyclase
VAKVEEHGLPPARAGVNAGPVVFRDGDYFGRTVNVASRVADYAQPHEVLVREEVVEEARDGSGRFESICEVALKGLLEPIALFRALPSA